MSNKPCFDGCRCAACKTVAAGVAVIVGATVTLHHEYCSEQQHSICKSAAVEPTHGNHDNQRPTTPRQRVWLTSASSGTSGEPVDFWIRPT